MLRTVTSAGNHIENSCLPLQISKTTSVESSCMMRLQNKQQLINLRPSLRLFRKKALNVVLKLMLGLFQFLERMMRQQLMALMVLTRGVQGITQWDAALLNGELFSRLEMGFHQMPPSMKQPILLQDTVLFARKMALYQLSNQKFFKMAPMISRSAPKLQKRY